MASLVDKVGSLLPLEPGERIRCAAYVPAVRPSMGSAVVAVSDRRLLFAPRSAFLSVGAWVTRRLEDVRVETTARRSLGFVAARRFEVIEDGEPTLVFEVDKRDAPAFRDALGRRTVARS